MADRSTARLAGAGLNTPDVVAQALAVGPIYSAGVLLFLVAGTAGAATRFVVAVTLVGAMALGWTFSLYARRYTGAGAVYDYISRAQSPALGLVFGGAYFILLLVIVGVLLVVAGLLWQGFASAYLGFDPPWWMGSVVAGFLVYLVTYRGVRLAVRTQLALTVLAALPLLILVLGVVLNGGPEGNTLRVFDPDTAGAGDISRAILFAVQLFLGFEAAASLSEEARDPRSTVPRAVLITIGVSGLFGLAVAYAATIGFGPDEVALAWGRDPTALSGLADRVVGEPLGALVAIAVLVDLLAVLAALVNTMARGTFALARDGRIPSALTAVSRHDTPVGGLAVSAVAATGVLVVAAFFDQKTTLLEALAIAFLLVVLVMFAVLVAGSPRLFAWRPAPLWRWAIVALALALPVAGIYGTLVPFPRGSRRSACGSLPPCSSPPRRGRCSGAGLRTPR